MSTAIDRTRPSVAVIGSGVSGLTAAYLLQRRYDVHLFEADERLGGHSHTHDVAAATGTTVAVDSGFIVHNDRTYPHLTRLFSELGVVTQDTEMSMSIRCEGCGLEYAGARGARGIFAQPSSLARPRFLGMIREVAAFHRRARALLGASDADAETDAVTFGGFLTEHRHSAYFVDHFAVPLVSAVWSSGRADALEYPARYLFRFLDNHGMLSVRGSPQWRTVVGGSRTYVERAAKGLTSVRTATPVRGLRRHNDGVEVRDDAGSNHHVDHVVVATHADQALRLLEDPTAAETEVLGAFRSSVNEAVLHTDGDVLPRSPHARASWNHLVSRCGNVGAQSSREPVMVSYHLNRLHCLGDTVGATDYVVTLGANQRIRPDAVIHRMRYEHPVFTRESVAAQRRLPELATRHTAFAGAWQGWGFHEDGCVSGVRAAAQLGVHW